MEFWIKAGQLILSLSILIVLHELGHFIPARIFKTRVEKFYLFFDAGFSLFKFKKGDTEYGIGWIPLGGYVKISGMIDESMDKEQLNQEPKPWEFRSKPAWQRLIIMIGGVTVNLIVGFVVYMMILFVWGQDSLPNENMTHGFAVNDAFKEYSFKDGDKILEVEGEKIEDAMEVNKLLFIRDARHLLVQHEDGSTEEIVLPEGTDQKIFQEDLMPVFTPRFYPVIDSVVAETPASKAGIQKNDSILSIDGVPVHYWNEFNTEMHSHKDEDVAVQVSRNNQVLDFTVHTDSTGVLGVFPKSIKHFFDIKHTDYSFGQSISKGFGFGYWTLRDYIAQFKFVFTKKGAGSVGGFGAIGGLFAPTWDWELFWERTALISIILAFMNILPIPALDGGHVLFLIYEIISGKAPSDKFLTRAQVVGMVLLIGLLLYANGMDIYRAIFGG